MKRLLALFRCGYLMIVNAVFGPCDEAKHADSSAVNDSANGRKGTIVRFVCFSVLGIAVVWALIPTDLSGASYDAFIEEHAPRSIGRGFPSSAGGKLVSAFVELRALNNAARDFETWQHDQWMYKRLPATFLVLIVSALLASPKQWERRRKQLASMLDMHRAVLVRDIGRSDEETRR